jgi:hypothetical protein
MNGKVEVKMVGANQLPDFLLKLFNQLGCNLGPEAQGNGEDAVPVEPDPYAGLCNFVADQMYSIDCGKQKFDERLTALADSLDKHPQTQTEVHRLREAVSHKLDELRDTMLLLDPVLKNLANEQKAQQTAAEKEAFLQEAISS